MTAVTYSRNSPYYTTPQVSKHVDYLDFWSGITVPPQTTDTIMILESKYHNRPDLLAYDLYGSPRLWWIFSLRNPDVIKDPIWDFNTGITIYTPSKESLKRYT